MTTIMKYTSASVLAFAAAGAASATAPAETPALEGEGEGESAPVDSTSFELPTFDNKAKLPVLESKETIKAIHSALGGQRRIFPDMESAMAALAEGYKKTNGFAGLPIIVHDGSGVDDTHDIYVATIGKRVKKQGEKNAVNAVAGIVVFPAPKFDIFLEQQRSFLEKLQQRETADSQFSGFRNAETVGDLVREMTGLKLDAESIASASRGNEGIDTSAFDDNWAAFRKIFLESKPEFEPYIPQKGMVLKAFRSKQYATDNPYTEALEKRGFWVKILSMFIDTLKTSAEEAGQDIDTSVLEEWLETRDSVNLTYTKPADVKGADALEL